MLANRNILVGVSGSIAAYKILDLTRRLIEEGALVKVVMTKAACRFITPLTFESVTGNSVSTDLFHDPYTHINLSKDADLFLIAPATANTLNKISCGIADDLLSNLWLAYEGPAIVAPAMNYRMYRHRTVQNSIRALEKFGVNVTGPVSGGLACGEEGVGRMADVSMIFEAVHRECSQKNLEGQSIVVTAGPTVEPIDPVRFISNRSSGKMGYAIALAASRRGADVTLISGPSSLARPDNISFFSVNKASEMEAAVLKHYRKATSLIMAAAVSDFTPAVTSKKKIRKTEISSLKLKKTPDILKQLGMRKGKRVLVGFAAEYGNDIESAKKKLKEKNLDLIVLNDIAMKGAGFDVDTNIVTVIDKTGKITEYPLMTKKEVADIILDEILKRQSGKNRR